MTRHPLGQHLATCSGPDNCDEYRALLSMTPVQYSAYLDAATSMRVASVGRTFRSTVGPTSNASYAPPDPYAAALARRRPR